MRITISDRAAFTLVEIMLVVALVGLLAVIAVPNIVRARTQSQTQACINNLRQIDDASQQWALENLKSAGAAVSFTDIQPYLKGPIVCPAAGGSPTFATSYSLSTVSNKPACLVLPATHVLPPDTAAPGPPHPVRPAP